MEQQHVQQQEQLWPGRNEVNFIGNADESQEMIVDQQNNIIRSESNQILEFSPPKQKEVLQRRNTPSKTPTKKV